MLRSIGVAWELLEFHVIVKLGGCFHQFVRIFLSKLTFFPIIFITFVVDDNKISECLGRIDFV